MDPGVPRRRLHHAGQPGLQTAGQVDDDQFVPGARGQAGVGAPGLRGQLADHLPEEDGAVGALLGQVGGGDDLPALGRQVGQEAAPGRPQTEAGALGVPEVGDGEGMAGQDDGVGRGRGCSMLCYTAQITRSSDTETNTGLSYL